MASVGSDLEPMGRMLVPVGSDLASVSSMLELVVSELVPMGSDLTAEGRPLASVINVNGVSAHRHWHRLIS